MHQDESQECIDLYVYRYAERKAKNIGQVTRLLKERSIDCLLNHKQQNFTVENMKQSEMQILSNGDEIMLDIGDKPNTSICDYGDDCGYICTNTPSEELNSSTYQFEFMYNEKVYNLVKNIPQRSRDEKDKLVDKIKSVYKNVQDEEIHHVLDMLVSGTNHTLLDQYLRKGYLRNAGKYYYFEPLEFEGSLSTMHDKTRPVTHKVKTILSQYKKEAKNASKPQNSEEVFDLVGQIQQHVQIGSEMHDQKPLKKDFDYYKAFKYVFDNMRQHFPIGEIDDEFEKRILAYHICETLKKEDSLVLLSYLLMNYERNNFTDHENYMYEYYSRYIISTDSRMKYVILPDKDLKLENPKIQIYKFDPEIQYGHLIKVDKSEYRKYHDEIIQAITLPKRGFAEIISYMDHYAKDDTILMKTRDPLLGKKSPGSFLENKSTKDVIIIVNRLLDRVDEPFLKTKMFGFTKYHMVIAAEILFHYYDSMGGVKYYFTRIEQELVKDVKLKKNKIKLKRL